MAWHLPRGSSGSATSRPLSYSDHSQERALITCAPAQWLPLSGYGVLLGWLSSSLPDGIPLENNSGKGQAKQKIVGKKAPRRNLLLCPRVGAQQLRGHMTQPFKGLRLLTSPCVQTQGWAEPPSQPGHKTNSTGRAGGN